MGATYDQKAIFQALSKNLMYVKGVVGTLLGTVASDAAIVTLFKLPSATNIKITGVTAKLSGGGTGAATAPSIAIMQSLAGTGAVSTVASSVWGTRADGEYIEMTLATTGGVDVAGGNTVSLGAVAGTVAEASEIFNDLVIEYTPDYD